MSFIEREPGSPADTVVLVPIEDVRRRVGELQERISTRRKAAPTATWGAFIQAEQMIEETFADLLAPDQPAAEGRT